MGTSGLRGQGQHFVHAVTRIVGRDFLLGEARRMRGAAWGDLCVIRDLRHEVIT